MTINLTLDKRVRKDGTQSILFFVVDGRDYRKKVFTNLRIEEKYWDKKKQRIRSTYKNAYILNKDLDEWSGRIRTATDKYATRQFTREQVIAYISGETNFDSIEDYIETEIKKSRSVPTYKDYKTAISSLRLHTGIKKEQKLRFQDVNYKLLDLFKRNAELSGMTSAAFNSYLNKIRAVMNDAYRKGYIYEEFKLDRRLIRPVRRKLVKTTSTQDILNGIEKIGTIYDWQAVAFWVLMFITRGMYPADVVNFTYSNVQLPDFKSKWNTPEFFEFWRNNQKVYLIHRRSKTSNRGNEDLRILIDNPNLRLFEAIKRTVIFTHFPKKPFILPELDDKLRIFNYDPSKDYILHNNIWDYYKKRVVKLTGVSYKIARKTFNTFALELAVPDHIRRVLLGHSDPTVLAHYDNFNTNALQEQVEEAHRNVLRAFHAKEIIDCLFEKTNDLKAPEWVWYNSGFHLVEEWKQSIK